MAIFRGEIFSAELGMNTSVVVFIPGGIPNSEMNVVYLFHGRSDNCTGWTRLTSVERYADEARCAVVMPEVQKSFYTDMKYGEKYFSYVAKELPELMHKMFNLSLEPEKSYVAGLSMGGYGALKCAFTFPERYAGCAAFSSACDMQACVDDETLSATHNEYKGVYGEELKVGDENDLFVLSTNANQAKVKPKIMMTCGTLDFLYPQNLKLKAHMEKLDFKYKFEEWEDDHTWRFWDASIQLAFDYFFDTEDEAEKV